MNVFGSPELARFRLITFSNTSSTFRGTHTYTSRSWSENVSNYSRIPLFPKRCTYDPLTCINLLIRTAPDSHCDQRKARRCRCFARHEMEFRKIGLAETRIQFVWYEWVDIFLNRLLGVCLSPQDSERFSALTYLYSWLPKFSL